MARANSSPFVASAASSSLVASVASGAISKDNWLMAEVLTEQSLSKLFISSRILESSADESVTGTGTVSGAITVLA